MSPRVSGFLENLASAQERVMRERAKVRWWYLVGAYPREGRWGTWVGPLHLTDSQLYQKIQTEKPRTPGLELYRLVYSPLQRVWIWDLRSESSLASSAQPIPGYDSDSPTVSGLQRPKSTVGVVQITPAATGKWPFVGFPPKVTLYGTPYVRSRWTFPRKGVVAQYREAKPQHSRHLFVLENGTFVVPHLDEENPDLGSPVKHFVLDVMKRPDPMTPLEASLRAKAPSL